MKTSNAAIIRVYNDKAGELLGYLNPDNHAYLGASGPIELPFGVTATNLSEVSVTVLAEKDLYGNVITSVINSGVCCILTLQLSRQVSVQQDLRVSPVSERGCVTRQMS